MPLSQNAEDSESHSPSGVPFSSQADAQQATLMNDYTSHAFAQQGYLHPQNAADTGTLELSNAFNYMYLDPQTRNQPDRSQGQMNPNQMTPTDQISAQYPVMIPALRYTSPLVHIQQHPYQIAMPQYAPAAYQLPKQLPKDPNNFQQPYYGLPQQPTMAYAYNAQNTHRAYTTPNPAAAMNTPPIMTNINAYPKMLESSGPLQRLSYPNNSPSSVRANYQAVRDATVTESGFPIRPIGTTSTPRGPPRKPKQSGFALWVGNLPPGTNVVDLKDHFSREATQDIESIKLIAKSNCAFVNYRTEEACSAAMTRFQELRFQGTRLVCRLRRGSTTSSSTPDIVAKDDQHGNEEPPTNVDKSHSAGKAGLLVNTDESIKLPERYFVLKSLTLQDLETSVRSGIWATQVHNEKTLNDAYENSNTVYLIFSANKSGEYFGYARMASPLSESAALSMFSPEQSDSTTPIEPYGSQSATDEVLPISVPTPATEWAPKGCIIDDSARGTIFWEAELDVKSSPQPSASAPEKSVIQDETAHASTPSLSNTISPASDSSGTGNTMAPYSGHGIPFRVEWISTRRLPFYRTKGLRNAWNGNREVKIARDGTEIEPAVGKKLVALFVTGPALG